MVRIGLTEFETIGPQYAKQLEKQCGIRSADDFLNRSLDEIHNCTQIDLARLRQWEEILNLFKIPNLSARECSLLYEIHINSIEELSHRQSLRIFYKLKKINDETSYIILNFPTFAQIDEWVYYAKLMTKRIKFGLNIPLLRFPMITLETATELKRYQILTAEDLLNKEQFISRIVSRVHMKKKAYRALKEMIELVKIPGVDVYFAEILIKAGIRSVNLLKTLEDIEILKRVEVVQAQEAEPIERLNIEHIKSFRKHLKMEVS